LHGRTGVITGAISHDLRTYLARLRLRNGVDVVVPGGYKYEILSGTESNLARHGRRMAGEFFRMLTF